MVSPLDDGDVPPGASRDVGDPPKAGVAPRSDPAHAGDTLIGRLVAGKFEIVELLGSGAMGAVYRAEQVALDKQVALKILHPGLRQDPTFVRRFHREAKAAAALEHPNSVSILDFGEEPDGLLYIAMEYLDGRDLFQVIQEEWPLPKERIVGLMRQVCGAVARAHDTGVVHRDLKPENIMVLSRVGDDGEFEELVKVCDFGIAHLQRTPDDISVVGKGLLVGTPEYMAPEVARGEEPDGRSDLYALGVVLYQMLTKRLPFEGGDPMRIALQHVQETPASPSTLVPEVDSFLEDISLMAMAKSPADRFTTARQMRSALRAALENREYNAADMSGVLSVLPPTVASSLISGYPNSAAPPPVIIPAAAPLPSDIGANRAPAPGTPVALTVSKLEENERLDTGGRGSTVHTPIPDPPRAAAKLPWLVSAAAAAVVGLAAFLFVGRKQADTTATSVAAPAALSVVPAPEPAVPSQPVVTGAMPVTLTSAIAPVAAAIPPATSAPSTTAAPAAAAKAPAKPAASKKSAKSPNKADKPDIDPDEHEPESTPTPPAEPPASAAPAPAPAPAKPSESGGLPPTWGSASGGSSTSE